MTPGRFARPPRRRRPAYRSGPACSNRGAGRRSGRRPSRCSGSRRTGPGPGTPPGSSAYRSIRSRTACTRQALEQVTASARPVAPATSVLLELSLNHPEELFAHQRGYVDENVILLRCIDRRDRAPGQLGSASLGPEPLWLELPRARLAERRLPLVRGVLEHQPDRRPVPHRFAFPRGDALVTQAPADLTDRAPLLADPLEDLPHDPGLFGQDLVPRRASPLVLVDVTVAVGRAAEHVDRTATCGVLLAPTAPLHDLRPLVLGDHALDLEQ